MSKPETPNSTTHSPDNADSWGKASDLSRKDPETLEKMNGRAGGGDSAGGAYPNPHTGKGGSDSEGYMGHGGQTKVSYEGGANANATAEEAKPGKNKD